MKLRNLLSTAILAAGLLMAPVPAFAASLRLNVTADPAMMDPITYSELVSGRIIRNIYEAFTDVTPDGKIVKVLAESWEPLEGENGFRFHLRKNVTFHSGRPFTAKDVKFTYESLLKPEMKGGLGIGYLENVIGAADVKSGAAKELTGVKIIDDHTIEVRFTKPEVLFPIYPIWFMDSGIVAENGADWPTKVSAGTGPFKFSKWTRGVEIELLKNEKYWNGAPKIDGLRFLIIPNDDTALSQYDAGELDVLDVQEAILRRVLKDEQYKDQLQSVPRAQSRYLGMNGLVYEPFKDKRVRQAVSLSLNRVAIIKGLYSGAGFPLNGITTPGVAGYSGDLPPLEYDPEKAKKLLADAGFPEGKGLPPVKISCTPPFKDEITYYASELNRTLGMPVEVNVVERATFIKSMNAGEVALFPWGWTAGYPDALYYLAQMWHSKSPYNRGRWFNADYDAAIDKATATVDDTERFALYKKAEQVFVEDMGAAPLPITAATALVKPNVKNARITPFGFVNFDKTEIE